MSDPSSERSPVIDLNLSDNGGHLRFFSIEEAHAWIAAEKEFWSWLPDLRRHGSPFDAISAEWHDEFEQVLKNHRKANEQNLRAWIRDRYAREAKNYPRVHSSTPLARFVDETRQANPLLASAMLAVLSNKNFGAEHKRLEVSASVRIGLFECGLIAHDAEKAALKSLHHEWTETLENSRAKLVEIGDASAAQQSEFDTQKQERSATFDGQLREFEDRLRTAEAKYRDELAMHAAVEYWGKREADHKQDGRNWGIAAFCWFAVFILILIVAVAKTPTPPEQVDGLLKTAAANGIEILDADAALTRAWVSYLIWKFVLILLLVWPTRILIRTYLSHQHLASDASERRIMIQTYLALIHDPGIAADEKLKKEILPKALDAVFRHTQTGLVDDALPQPGAIFGQSFGK